MTIAKIDFATVSNTKYNEQQQNHPIFVEK